MVAIELTTEQQATIAPLNAAYLAAKNALQAAQATFQTERKALDAALAAAAPTVKAGQTRCLTDDCKAIVLMP